MGLQMSVLYFELCRLMICMPNYALSSRQGKIGSVYHAIYYVVAFIICVSCADCCQSYCHGSIDERAMLCMEEIGQLQPKICRWPSHGVHHRQRFFSIAGQFTPLDVISILVLMMECDYSYDEVHELCSSTKIHSTAIAKAAQII